MKKRIIIIGIILIILMLIIIPFTVTASKDLIKYDENGKPYIYGGEEVPEELKGKEGSIVVPRNVEETSINLQNDDMDEAAAIRAQSEDIDYEELHSRVSKIEERNRKFDEILFKYYGEEIEKIKSDMREEGIHAEYGDASDMLFPPSGVKLLKHAVNIYNTTSIQEEKDIIKEFCQVTVSGNDIGDIELENIINNME